MTNTKRKSVYSTALSIAAILSAALVGNSGCSVTPMGEDATRVGDSSSLLAPVPISPASAVTGQKVAVPSYFYPCNGTPECYWDQLNSGAPTAGLAIINPNSGPGTAADPNYASQTLRTQAAGIIVLGYVHTSYGNRPSADVESEVDRYYLWYGVDGIFFDEASTDCNQLPYYQSLYNYVKAKSDSRNKVALNPGTNTSECYVQASDIILNFEDTYSRYVDWRPSGWEYNYPAERFWHLVHNTAKSKMTKAIRFSKQRQAGWVYVTSDQLPNPWDTLPAVSYWNRELSLVAH